MGAPSRLNVLVTHGKPANSFAQPASSSHQSWHQILAHLLEPLGVRTFEATTGTQAVQLIETNPIHLAIVDTRLPFMSGLGVLELVARIRDRAAQTAVEEVSRLKEDQAPAAGQDSGAATAQPRKIEVRYGTEAQASKVVWPTVILLTPARDEKLMREALKFNAFSVLTEPVDLNLMLDIMARAMRRFHQNQWPQ